MLWELSSDISHRQRDRPTSPPHVAAQLQPKYIQSLQVQVDLTKTLGQVQDTTLGVITWVAKKLWGTKFRHLSQTNGPTDVAPMGRSKTLTHIYLIPIGFRLIRLKPKDKFRTQHRKKITGVAKMLWGPKFRHLSQTNGRTDVAPKGRCKTSTHIYSISIGFSLIRPKPQDKFTAQNLICVCMHACTKAKITSMSQITSNPLKRVFKQ